MDIKLAIRFLWMYFYNKWFFALLSIAVSVIFLFIAHHKGWLNDLYIPKEKNSEAADFVATVLVGMAAFFLGIVQLKSSNDTFKRELYSDFNNRYDKLNEYLNNIIDEELCEENINKEQVATQQHETKDKKYEKSCCCCNLNKKRKTDEVINDYINLCAEEYYWYRKGRIDCEVWQHWKAGMKFHFNKKQVQCILRRELSQKDSYYKLYEMPEVNRILSVRCACEKANNHCNYFK
jgi:hypothetical protein